MGREAADEQEGGLDNDLLVPRLVLGEPFSVVVPPKLAQEIEQLRAEVCGVGNRHLGRLCQLM